jgi:co-chaperonin GroES (HSP10)
MTTIKSVGFKPVDNKILLRKIESGDSTSSGIYVGKVEGIDKAEVIAIGGRVLNLAVGNIIMVDWKGCIPAKLGHETYYIGIDSLVVGIFDEDYQDPVIQLK